MYRYISFCLLLFIDIICFAQTDLNDSTILTTYNTLLEQESNSANNFDHFRTTSEIRGRYVNIKANQLIGFNAYEGFKLGFGFQTSESLFRNASFGSYFRYGFRDKDWKYGVNFNQKLPYGFNVKLSYSKDVAEVGTKGFDMISHSLLTGIMVSTMDRVESVSVGFGYSQNDISTKLNFNYANITPTMSYPFCKTDSIYSDYQQYGAKFSIGYPNSGLSAYGINDDAVSQLFVDCENGKYAGGSDFDYCKIGARLHLQTDDNIVSLRADAATIFGDCPLGQLYSALGYHKGFGLDIQNTFATMRPNSYASRSYLHLFGRCDLKLINYLLLSPFFTKDVLQALPVPSFTLCASAGWSDSDPSLFGYSNGFYEGGIVANLFPFVTEFKLGIGYFWRMGQCRSQRAADNRAICLSMAVAIL